MSRPFGPSASSRAWRQLARSGRTKLWKAWASVAYGMSRLYWSNLPDAKRPRGGTSTLCNSCTTEDLPIPEYPDTSTSSGGAVGHDTVEGSEQRVNFALSAVKLLRNKQPVRYIVSAELEWVDVAVRLPLRQAAP